MNEVLHQLAQALRAQQSTLSWALRFAGEGDPLPAAWRACTEPRVMFFFLSWLAPSAAVAALSAVSESADCYPHARECLRSAARELRLHRHAQAQSLLDSALVHFPGRGTAMPRPQRASGLSDALCEAFRSEVQLSMDLVQRGSAPAPT